MIRHIYTNPQLKCRSPPFNLFLHKLKGGVGMKTPIEFDYDLWTITENQVKTFYVRVKNTGKVSKVNFETMKFLRNEEKKYRRSIIPKEIKIKNKDGTDQKIEISILSLNTDNINSIEFFLVDKTDYEEIAMFNVLFDEIGKHLNPIQYEVFKKLVKEELPCLKIGNQLKINESNVRWYKKNIGNIYKKVLKDE